MGFPVCRVVGEVDDELLCAICRDVLEDPLETTKCQHAFCSPCIKSWLTQNHTCPVDRKHCTLNQLQPVCRLLSNLLSRLTLTCENQQYGCKKVLNFDSLLKHQETCTAYFNKEVQCEQGCGLSLIRKNQESHNCVLELNILLTSKSETITDLSDEVGSLKDQLGTATASLAQQKHIIQSQNEAIHAQTQELTRLGGVCYRINPAQVLHEGERRGYTEDSEEDDYEEVQPCRHLKQYTIEVLDNGNYQAELDIAQAFFGCIVGREGSNRKRLENETSTRIRMRRNLLVVGQFRKNVTAACRRICLIVEAARQRMAFTQFISLPMIEEGIREKYEEFKCNVLSICAGSRGITTDIFQNPLQLHLAIGVLVLMSDKERILGRELLEECNRRLIGAGLCSEPLYVSVQGLHHMNDDPAEVDVLYSKVNMQVGGNKLQLICNSIAQYFTRCGFMHKHETVQLQVTLMNTLFQDGHDDDRGNNLRGTFDARRLLELYRYYDIGVCRVETIDLSQRHGVGLAGY